MQEYKFSIVPWISWKTYFVNDTQITIIFEQRTECYYLLYNTLSVCWNDINNKTSICLSEIQNLSLLISDGVINLNLSEIQYDIRCNSIIKTKELPEYILNNIKEYITEEQDVIYNADGSYRRSVYGVGKR